PYSAFFFPLIIRLPLRPTLFPYTTLFRSLTTVEKDNYVVEPNKHIKPINPLKGKTNNGWHFEQEVYDDSGIARALKAGGGSGNIPKMIEGIDVHPFSKKLEFNGYKQRDIRSEEHTSELQSRF